MNIELKPIAESKVRQLGGDVCGVLVRKDGRLAAVDEHGRVQWLRKAEEAEEAEEKGRVLMDMCRDLKGQVRELKSQIWAVGADHCRAFILRKQAEAVEMATADHEIKSATDGSKCYSVALRDYAQRLRQQADEAERAGGEK